MIGQDYILVRDRGLDYLDTIMSNFDHTIEENAEEQLKQGNCYGHYVGWNFSANVYFDGETFKCEVWNYGSPVEIIEASNLSNIMNEVSNNYGWD